MEKLDEVKTVKLLRQTFINSKSEENKKSLLYQLKVRLDICNQNLNEIKIELTSKNIDEYDEDDLKCELNDWKNLYNAYQEEINIINNSEKNYYTLENIYLWYDDIFEDKMYMHGILLESY